MRSPFSKIIRSLCFAISIFGLVPGAWAATTVTPAAKEVGSGGASYQLTVTSDTTWTVSTTATWVTVSAGNGPGQTDLTVEVEPNTTGFDRHTTLTIDDQTHTITQYATALSATAGGATGTQRPASQPVATVASVVSEAAEAAPATSGNTFRLDTRFAARFEASGATVNSVVAVPDGGFLVGGDFSSLGGPLHSNLAYVHADGSVEAAFNTNTMFDGRIQFVAIQQVGTDMKLLVSGLFTSVNGTARTGLARLNQDGTLDTAFNPVVLGDYPGDNQWTSLVVQADGKILLAGGFSVINGTACDGSIARLNADGTLDTTFDPGTGFLFSQGAPSVKALAVQGDGKIVAGGSFTTFNGTARNGIVRLNTDGTLDLTFDPGTGVSGSPAVNPGLAPQVTALALQGDGKIIAGGSYSTFNGTARSGIARLNTDGTLDTSFNPGTGFNTNIGGQSIAALAVQTDDGKIVAGGPFTAFNGTGRRYIARLNTDGTLDPTFDTGWGIGGDMNSGFATLAVQTDGKIVASGSFSTFDGTTNQSQVLVRLTPTGGLDTSVTTDLRLAAGARPVPVADGKFLVYGDFEWVNGTARHGIARLNADGTLDTTFDPGTGSNGSVYTLAVQTDGKIVAGGSFITFNGTACNHLARLNTDGSLDTAFNPGTAIFSSVYALALQGDGKILAGGSNSTLVRLNTDGTPDTTFGFVSDGFNVFALALQGDGEILVGGDIEATPGYREIARLNADGTLDTTFGADTAAGFDGRVNALAVQPDGKIVVVGDFTTYDNTARACIARLNADGTLDTTFDPGTGFDNPVTTLALQADGKIFAGGYFSQFNGTTVTAGIARLNTDGTLDTGFSIAVEGMNYLTAPGVSLTDDGRLFLANVSAISGSVVQAGLVLLIPDMGPAFTIQPQSATVTVGGTVTFTAAATGTPAPAYQWYKGTTLLTGKTEATLTLSNVQNGDGVSYTVVATNDVGSATSNPATLTVNVPVTPPAPSSGGGGGGGGGGAMGECYLAMLLAAAALRFRQHQCRSSQKN